MKKPYFATMLSAVILLSAPTLVWAEDPGEVLTDTITRGFAVLRDPALQSPESLDIRRTKLWELLGPLFSFEEISKRALGYHWKSINAQQQEEFTKTFTETLKDVYLNKSDDYLDGEIVFVRQIVKGSRSKVQTHFVNGDKKIVVDFSMKKIRNDWKIYDITIEKSVSFLANYRTQFNSILSKSSFEDLLQRLREKNIELAN